jgi:omega-amidase
VTTTGVTLRVAAIQVDCAGSREKVERRSRTLIERAAERGARVACMPEHWIPEDGADLGSSLPFFSAVARENGIYVIPGADFVRRGGGGESRPTVESVIIAPDGSEVGRQRKVHLFRDEKKIAEPGDSYKTFEVDGVKVGIAICHDLVYPEVPRILALRGAEIVFSPAKIGAPGIAPWELYVKARALENRVFVVSSNYLDPPRYPGASPIVGFSESKGGAIVYPELVGKGGGRQNAVVADLDLGSARPQRAERLRSRRPETYSDLLLG